MNQLNSCAYIIPDLVWPWHVMAKIWRKVLNADLRSAVELQEWRHSIKSADPASTGEERHIEKEEQGGEGKRKVL